MDIIKKNNHKPQFVIKMILPLKICCSVHEFKLLLNLLDICASYSCLVTIEQDKFLVNNGLEKMKDLGRKIITA
jgi:hypothetical protein